MDNAPGALFIPVALWNNPSHIIPKEKNEKVVIVHAPTNRVKKGTAYIIDQVKKLQKGNVNIEFVLVEGLSEEKARQRYERADIAIDQILIGWYGLFSVEMMSLGKPVICYIRKDLKKYTPDLPIFNSDKESLVVHLETLIKDKKKRVRLGEEGVNYVSKKHDSIKIAGRLVRLYKSL